MTRRHHSVLVRICAVALLLLASLPVTAPFSTLDLVDFFRGAPVDTGSSVQAKTASDKKLSSSLPGVVIDLYLSRPLAARGLVATLHPASAGRPADIPLRV
jgi:hypothetical protein